MEKLVARYKNGSILAKDLLLDEIMEQHNYNISREEAKILLYKKYGRQEVF
jgi:hypothetical protein